MAPDIRSGGIRSSRQNATDSNIPFANIRNFRDLGDIAAGQGRRTKRGVIYRSARTTACRVGDVDVLTKKFGIKTIVDLRGPPRHGKLKEATEDGLDALFGAYPPHITVVDAEEDGTKNQSRSMQQLAYVDKRVKAAIKEHIGILGTAVLFLVYFSLKAISIMKIIAKPLPPLHHAAVWAVARCKFFALTWAIEHWGGFGTLYYLIAKHNSKAVKRKQKERARIALRAEVKDVRSVDGTYMEYIIHVYFGGDGRGCSRHKWKIAKRYSAFALFHEELQESLMQSVHEFVCLPEFPPKKICGSMESAFVEKRRASLDQYLRTLLSERRLSKNRVLRAFLCDATPHRISDVWNRHLKLVRRGAAFEKQGSVFMRGVFLQLSQDLTSLQYFSAESGGDDMKEILIMAIDAVRDVGDVKFCIVERREHVFI
eukprot:g4507.t1